MLVLFDTARDRANREMSHSLNNRGTWCGLELILGPDATRMCVLGGIRMQLVYTSTSDTPSLQSPIGSKLGVAYFRLLMSFNLQVAHRHNLS